MAARLTSASVGPISRNALGVNNREYTSDMSDSTIIECDTNTTEPDRGGRFVKGGIPGPGRPKGARSRLGEQFLEDLRDVWSTHGKAALIACAVNEPSQFCRVMASLMPKQLDLNSNIVVEVGQTLQAYRALLGVGERRLEHER